MPSRLSQTDEADPKRNRPGRSAGAPRDHPGAATNQFITRRLYKEWRIDVDAVHLARVGEAERFEGVVVLGVNHNVCGPVASSIHRAQMLEPRIDRLTELGDHGQIFDRNLQSLIVRNNCGHPVPKRPDDERAIVTAIATRDLHPAAHRVRRQRHPLGKMALEHKVEGTFRSDLIDASAEVLPERRVVDTSEQRIEFLGHRHPPSGSNLIGNTLPEIAPTAQVRQRPPQHIFWFWWLVGERALLDPVGVHDVDEGPRFGTRRDDRSEVVKEAGRHFLTRKALA